MGKSQPQYPKSVSNIPPEFMPFATNLIDYLKGRMGEPYPNPYQQNVLSSFFGANPSGGAGGAGGGFFGAGQNFLGGLLQGQLPASIRESAAQNLAQSQAALNSQLQLRGAFFGTPGLQMQQGLARDATRDLNNLIFQNAMGAIPAGLGLFSGAAGLGGIPSGIPPSVGAGIDLLGGLRGQLANPTYAPDPWMQLLGLGLGLLL